MRHCIAHTRSMNAKAETIAFRTLGNVMVDLTVRMEMMNTTVQVRLRFIRTPRGRESGNPPKQLLGSAKKS